MKKFKGVVAILLVAIMAFSMTACGSVKEIAAKDFKSTVKDVLDCDKEDLYESESKDIECMISYSGEDYDKYTVSYTEYEDEEEAQYYFDLTAARFKFYKSHAGVEGKMKISKNSILMDAEITSDYDGDSYDRYGGTYICGATVISIYTTTGKDKDKDVVDDLIAGIGYPKPSRA